jgi:asparagine synthase (glutamine-hydrolysing)
MILYRLTDNRTLSWFHKDGVSVKGYCFTSDDRLLREAELCDYVNDKSEDLSLEQKMKKLNGLFAIVLHNENTVVVDRCRSIPLFYREIDDRDIIFADEIENLFEPGEQKSLCPHDKSIFSVLGFTFEESTLLGEYCCQVLAGHIAQVNCFVDQTPYYQLYSEPATDFIDYETAKVRLREILNNIGKRTARLIEGKKTLLSLSGGRDSRLIACMLKNAGITDVLCFTYGRKTGNPEWERSQKTAEKLGFKWHFVDHEQITDMQWHKRQTFCDYYKYAAQYSSKFIATPYFAAEFFAKTVDSPADTVYISGHGGDFLAGSHLKPDWNRYSSIDEIKDYLLKEHLNLTRLTKAEKISAETFLLLDHNDKNPMYQQIETWELQERQAKYIVNANRLWQFFGFTPLMPLFDSEFMDFMMSLPFEYRLNQKLYREVVDEIFAEYGLDFEKVNNGLSKLPVQNVKSRIKRMFPFIRRRPSFFAYDYFDFKRLTKHLRKELRAGGRKRKILSFNGIFTEWYLMQIDKTLQDEENR